MFYRFSMEGQPMCVLISIFSCSRFVNMSRAQSKANKLAVLKVIKEKKDYLFGSSPINLTTKKPKQLIWTEVLRTAQSLGLATANRDWTYARDHLFGLWKSRTLARRDNAMRRGTAGAKKAILDEVDNCILDILGNESTSVVQGLSNVQGLSSNLNSELVIIETQRATPSNKDNPMKRKLGLGGKHEELKVQLLESELYKIKLKILLLEKKLGMKRSKFTEDLEKESNDKKENEK